MSNNVDRFNIFYHKIQVTISNSHGFLILGGKKSGKLNSLEFHVNFRCNFDMNLLVSLFPREFDMNFT